MLRASSIVILAAITLVTGCTGSARNTAMAIGGAVAIGGIAFTAQQHGRSCDSGELDSDLSCATGSLGGQVLGLIVAGIGVGLLVGAGLAGGDDDEPEAGRPAPPAPVAEVTADAAAVDPANPPPAMEPEPAAW